MMTKAEAISNHRKLWHWIAKWTRELKRKVEKEEYFKFYNIPYDSIPPSCCYCCEYDFQFNNDCVHCPIDWGNTLKCYNKGALFIQWELCTNRDWERAAELADKIAELAEMPEGKILKKIMRKIMKKRRKITKRRMRKIMKKRRKKRRRTNYEENKV